MQRIGALARVTNTSPTALRYYESAGLLPPPERTENGYRAYPPSAAGRVDFIRRAQALGLTIAEIRRLVAEPTEDPAALRHAVAHKLAALQRRRQELERLERDLEQIYVRLVRHPAPACGHVGDCGCWLPTEEEVMAMAHEVAGVQQTGCCDCPDCPDCSECCGPTDR